MSKLRQSNALFEWETHLCVKFLILNVMKNHLHSILFTFSPFFALFDFLINLGLNLAIKTRTSSLMEQKSPNRPKNMQRGLQGQKLRIYK